MKNTIVSTGLIFLISAFFNTGLSAKTLDDSFYVPTQAEIDSVDVDKVSDNIQILGAFSEGSAIACLDTKYGIVSENGLWLVEPAFEWNGNVTEGFWISIDNSTTKQVSYLGE